MCLLFFTKSAKSGDLTLGLLPVANFLLLLFLLSFLKSNSRSTITGFFYHIYKSSKIYGNRVGKLGNSNITEKNDDGGVVGV